MNKKLLSTVFMLFVLVSAVYAEEVIVLHENPTVEEKEATVLKMEARLVADHSLTQAQIKRTHEVNLAEKKIEVLARLKNMEASNTYVSSRSGASIKQEIVTKQEVTNTQNN